MCLFRRCHGMSRHRSTSTPSRLRRWTIVVKLLRSRVGPASQPWLMLARCQHCLAPLSRCGAKKFTDRSNVDGAWCSGPDLGLLHRSNDPRVADCTGSICEGARRAAHQTGNHVRPRAIIFSVITIAGTALPGEIGGFGGLQLCVGFWRSPVKLRHGTIFPCNQDG
jgi:hypothetical protein